MQTIHRILGRLMRAFHHFTAHGGTMLAAAIAYYLAISLFPLMLTLVAGLGWFFRATATGQDAQQQVLAAVAEQVSPELRDQISEALTTVEQQAGTSGTIGLLLLLVAAIGIFTQLDYAFDRLWDRRDVGERPLREWATDLIFTRLKSLTMLIGVGAFVIAVMIASITWQGVEAALQARMETPLWLRQWVQPLLHVALNVVAFTLLYAFVPKSDVRWQAALAGGVLSALLWELGRQVLAAYVLPRNLPSAYGVIGSFMAIMLWTYYAMIVILFGAVYAKIVNDEATPASAATRQG
jgi:membrane protein